VSRTQRLTFLAIAAVIAVVAVVVLVAADSGSDEQEATTGAQATATPSPTETASPGETPTETPEPTPTPKPKPPLVVAGGEVDKLRFKQDETIRFRVRSDVADHVHVHGYDLFKDVEPGKTITFSFPAEITGIFEIELEDRGEEIAQLRVDP
jgi:hypothetical protein